MTALTRPSQSGGYKGRVRPASFRLPASLLAGAVLAVALLAATVCPSSSAQALGQRILTRSFDSGPVAPVPASKMARALPALRGGPVTASTGEVVDVRVSDLLPATVTPENWAEFMVGLVHGPELASLTAYVVTYDEMQDVCGRNALGCYSAHQMIVPGEVTPDGTTPEEIIRHEYGHHVAFNRVNTPWVAVDWGPKYWASSANVCARVARREAFPGNQGSNYPSNPGEAWAETYRLLDERKDGITTGTWPIIAPSFYPTEAALLAAERDVVQPWTASTTTVFTHQFPKVARKVWWIRLATPLDGELRIAATLPKGGEYDVALVGANRTTVLQRAQWASQRVKRLATNVCGTRAAFLRVTRSGSPGRARVSVTKP
jgi:hypothetical protein